MTATATVTCACGSPAYHRLRYRDHKRGLDVVTEPKCGRCADRAAFGALLSPHVSFVKAFRIGGAKS
jgi:hypothetical protein